MINVNAVVIAAQDVEVQPFLAILEDRDSLAADALSQTAAAASNLNRADAPASNENRASNEDELADDSGTDSADARTGAAPTDGPTPGADGSDTASQATESLAGSTSLLGIANRIETISAPTGLAWLAHTPSGKFLVLRTGIGLVATASSLGWALSAYKPRCVVSIGTAGGLARSARVLDVVAGSEYAYGTADATAFGYTRGQVPGHSASFAGDAELLEHLRPDIRVGLMLAGDSFVTEHNVGDMREAFPQALTTDMETTAAAQASLAWGVPFLGIRCVSDLCGPEANEDYEVTVEEAAAASAVAAAEMLGAFFSRPSRGRSPLFDQAAIEAALLLVMAKADKLKPSENIDAVPDDIAAATRQQLADRPEFIDEALGLIAAARAEIDSRRNVSITAKKYDSERAKLVTSLGITSERGQIAWPPTSQTVSKRSDGYWNNALSQLGLQVKAGRQRGTVKFSEEEYLEALRDFGKWAEEQGSTPSVAAYGRWLKEENAAGTRPSSAAIRQRFGAWRAAVDTALK
ncbi:MAG: 5'-methylthioadenosine/S-adenosylhomocysteine nucleosidase [Actinomycetaceae bacterium]|nr:5'-methylthioadenosine/S-adenosylhomocysteine nucleosidase [Actinomycetaceae bacterium]